MCQSLAQAVKLLRDLAEEYHGLEVYVLLCKLGSHQQKGVIGS